MSNQIKRSKVDISFTSESDYSSQGGYRSKNSDALVDAIDELGRVLAIEGRADDARAALDEAIGRVISERAEK